MSQETESSVQMPDWNSIGDWDVIEKIKEGQYGSVFLVKKKTTGLERIMKIIPKLRNDSPDDTFEQEHGSLMTLQGLNGVVHRFSSDFDTLPDHRFFILEHLDIDLDELRTRNPEKLFKPETTLQLLWEVVNIVERIHQRGILHQDIMMSNMMVKYHEDFSKLKFVDFGLSSSFFDAATYPSEINFIESSFSSPELCDGYAFDCSEEIASIALLSVNMATGRIPWRDLDTTAMTRKKKVYLENLHVCLPREVRFLYPIIYVMMTMPRGELIDYQLVRDVIKGEYKEFTPERLTGRIKVVKIDGELRLE